MYFNHVLTPLAIPLWHVRADSAPSVFCPLHPLTYQHKVGRLQTSTTGRLGEPGWPFERQRPMFCEPLRLSPLELDSVRFGPFRPPDGVGAAGRGWPRWGSPVRPSRLAAAGPAAAQSSSREIPFGADRVPLRVRRAGGGGLAGAEPPNPGPPAPRRPVGMPRRGRLASRERETAWADWRPGDCLRSASALRLRGADGARRDPAAGHRPRIQGMTRRQAISVP